MDQLWHLATTPAHPAPQPQTNAVLLGGPRDGQQHRLDAGSHTLIFTETLLTGYWCEVYRARGETTAGGDTVLRYDPLLSDIYLGQVNWLHRIHDWLAARGLVRPRTLQINAGGPYEAY